MSEPCDDCAIRGASDGDDWCDGGPFCGCPCHDGVYGDRNQRQYDEIVKHIAVDVTTQPIDWNQKLCLTWKSRTSKN